MNVWHEVNGHGVLLSLTLHGEHESVSLPYVHQENLHEVLLSLTLHGEHESVYLPLHEICMLSVK